MWIHYGQASSASGISRINPEKYRLYPAIAEMLVDQVASAKDFHFQIDAINELRAIGDKFQKVVGVRLNILYLAPDLAVTVRPSLDGQ